MKKMLLMIIVLLLCCNVTLVHAGHQDHPSALGPLPTPAQLRHQRYETIMFIHFCPNTFTGVQWGSGKEDPDVFNPTDMDCEQWVQTAKDCGFDLIIPTIKHHDGFCLWPSDYTEHSVKNSIWRDGNGDVAPARQARAEFERQKDK